MKAVVAEGMRAVASAISEKRVMMENDDTVLCLLISSK